MRGGLIGLALLGAAGPAATEDFCPALDVPEELDLVCETRITAAGGETLLRPREGMLTGFDRLRVRRLDAPVEAPAAWLAEQMTLDVSPWRNVVEGLALHPDNPIKPEALAPLLEAFRQSLEGLSEVAKQACEAPVERTAGRWTMRCTYDAEVASAVVFLDLRTGEGLPVAADFRAASPSRARQFEALLNGFRPNPE